MALYLDTFQTAFNNNTTSKWQIDEMAFFDLAKAVKSGVYVVRAMRKQC